MKKIVFSIAFIAFAIALGGQSPFRVKIIDAQTSENVEKAIVFIEEIPLPDQETDKYGVVSFQNVPEDRKVRVNVRKKGYLPNQTEIVANRAIKVDNNIIIKLEKEPTSPQVIIYGEVTDKEGNEIADAIVEVSILGKPHQTKTDESGNYQIRIDGSALKSVSSFQIEVKKNNCEKYKSTESVPKSEIINKDLKLNCFVIPIPQLNSITTGKKDDILFELLECKQSGQNIECVFRITAKENDIQVFNLLGGKNNSRIIDAESGSEYFVNGLSVADKTDDDRIDKSIVRGYPVKATMTFTPVTKNVNVISKLEMKCGATNKGWFTIEMRDIPVKH